MSNYQVLARKYRPQRFQEIFGQEAIVTTLKNAIKQKRLAHAYLFCGSRGTGKTTLARIFAKALNCQQPTADGEPCTQCSSCREIASGHSLDVLEIDGASHRGIDDIRQINETVGYASSAGCYKVYIIDEVHMLTKEAFNALLKTLEEPPAKVMFLFATTEPHKVLPTILSRCQRFNLNRIPTDLIIYKLQKIASDLNLDVELEALRLIAQNADGGLRDAESLFDQIIAFHDEKITLNTVAEVLGVMSRDTFFLLDRAAKEGNLAVAFDIIDQAFSQGKDLIYLAESLTDHFRTLLLIKLAGTNTPFLSLSDADHARYEDSAKLYTQEQCLTIIDQLIEAQNTLRFHPSPRIALENLLLKIIRIHQRLPIEFLVRRLAELEQAVQQSPDSPSVSAELPIIAPSAPQETPQKPTPLPTQLPPPAQEIPPTPLQKSAPKPLPPVTKSPPPASVSMTEDPTPSLADLGKKSKPNNTPPSPMPPKTVATPPQQPLGKEQQSRYDTVLQFAAIELEGTIQKR